MRKNVKCLILYLVLAAFLLSGCTADRGKVPEEQTEKVTDSVRDKIEEVFAEAKEEIPEADALAGVRGDYVPYGYETLDEEGKKIYRQFLAGVLEQQDAVTVSYCSEDKINQVVNMVFTDHPEFFWLDQQVYHYEEDAPGDEPYTLELQMSFNLEKPQIDDIKAQIEQRAEEILSGLPSESDVYSKIRYVYEYLGTGVTYDENSVNNQNIQSVFLNGSTVCMGYSRATQYLLGKMGIFCTLVTGTAAPENEEHAWNLVKIGENYYYVDTTWGNPGFAEQQEGSVKEVSYTYLCCTTDTLSMTHTPDDALRLPECTDDSYNYYKLNGTWYDTYDEGTVYQVLADSISQGYEKSEFKFAGRDSYSQAEAALVDGDLIERAVRDNYAFSQGETFQWNVGYSKEEMLLTVYWR